METVKVSTSQHIDIDYPVAGLGERLAAYFLDYLLFGFVYIVFFIIIIASAIGVDYEGAHFLIFLIIYGSCFVFYDLLCEVFMNGQSLGKKILKIKVVSLDGAQPSLGQYFIRWIFRIIDFVLTAGLGGFIAVAVSEKKQRIGDIVAGTTLIKTKPKTHINQIAFHPPVNDYVPVFETVHFLSDKDIELVHEVIQTYYKTFNASLIYQMADKVKNHLNVTLPEGMNELDFLKTITMDYNHVTSQTI